MTDQDTQQAIVTPEQFIAIKNKAVIDLKNALEIFVQSISEFRTKCPVMRRAYQHFDIGFLRYQEAVVRTEIDDLVIDGRPLPVVANDVPPLEAA